MAAEWILGVIFILIGSVGNNFGQNLVSLGHKIKKSNPDDHVKDIESVETDPTKTKTRNWRFVGTIIFVLGNLFTFAAFGFAAQSLLASLESVQFVSNVFFLKFIHGDQISLRLAIATTSIVIGNTLVVLFSNHSAELYTSRGLLRLYRDNNAYHGYLAFAFVLFIITHFTYRKYNHSRTVLKNPPLWMHSFIEPLSFTISSAIMGSQAVLNSKSMSMLIQSAARNRLNEFERPTIYVILVTWLFLVSYWVRRLDLGLELFPPLFIIPVMQVFFIVFSIICGGIYFEEFTHYSPGQYVGFLFGVLLILGGVYGLAPPDTVVIDSSTMPAVPLGKIVPIEGEGGEMNSHRSTGSFSGVQSKKADEEEMMLSNRLTSATTTTMTKDPPPPYSQSTSSYFNSTDNLIDQKYSVKSIEADTVLMDHEGTNLYTPYQSPSPSNNLPFTSSPSPSTSTSNSNSPVKSTSISISLSSPTNNSNSNSNNSSKNPSLYPHPSVTPSLSQTSLSPSLSDFPPLPEQKTITKPLPSSHPNPHPNPNPNPQLSPRVSRPSLELLEVESSSSIPLSSSFSSPPYEP